MIEEYRRYLLYKKHLSITTINAYSSHIKEFINWYNASEDKELVKMNDEIIRNYREYLIIVKNNKIQSINGKISALVMLDKFLGYKSAPNNYIWKKRSMK